MKNTISLICLMLAMFALSACGNRNNDAILPSILPSVEISPNVDESPDADTSPDIDILPDASPDNNGTEASPETSPAA